MYLNDYSVGNGSDFGFAGFGEPTEEELDKQSRAAIESALKRNPSGGYVKGSSARAALDQAVDSVPKCRAGTLGIELGKAQTPLGKLFKRRLATETRRGIIGKLIRKTDECLVQKRKELARLEEAERRRAIENQRTMTLICENIRQEEVLVEELCQKLGRDSTECKEQRSSVARGREKLRKLGFRCP